MSFEKQMIKFINIARQQPSYFISIVQKQINSFMNEREIPLNDQIIYQTNQGKKAWLQALTFLKQQKSMPPLQEHEGLCSSSNDHVKDLVENNIFGHTGSDGSTFSERILRYCRKGHGSMAQLIGADFHYQNRNHAQMTVLGLIIDDGVLDRGHRKTIFNPSYHYIGCKSQIQGQKVITVFNITQNKLALRNQSILQNTGASFLSKNPNQNIMQNTAKSSQNYKSAVKQNSIPKEQCKEHRIPEKQNKKMPEQNSNKMKTSSSDNFKQTGSKGSKAIGSQNRKLTEKKQSSKIYYEDDSKITEVTTTLIYNDGTIEQKIEKHTVYLQQ